MSARSFPAGFVGTPSDREFGWSVRHNRTLALGLALLPAVCLAACDDSDDPPGGAQGSATVFAVATDFMTTGVATTIAVPELDVTVGAVDGVASTDPVVRLHDDRLFIVNRFGQDNITVLEADDLTLVAQLSTGAGTNPQDVAVLDDFLYVAALNTPDVLVLDLERPDDGVIDTIDLSDLDAEDGLPDCLSIVAVGERLVVSCGILDLDFQPRGPAVAAIIDGASRTLVDEVALSQARPVGLAQPSPGRPGVLVSTVDDFSSPAAGGCVEEIVLDGDVPSAGCLVENADLGGFASALAPDLAGDRLWMTVVTSFDPTDFGAYGELVSVPAAGGDLQRHEMAEEARPMDLALCPTGHLAVSDAIRGVRILEPEAVDELTTGTPLDLGLPPVSNGLVCY